MVTPNMLLDIQIYLNNLKCNVCSLVALLPLQHAPSLFTFSPMLITPSVVYIPLRQSLYLLMHCSHLPAIMVYHTCHINSCFTAARYHWDTQCVSHTPWTMLTVTWQGCSHSHVLTVTFSGTAGRRRGWKKWWDVVSWYKKRLLEGACFTHSGLLWLQCV